MKSSQLIVSQIRKKGHVIIPLRRCASEAIQSVEVKRLSPPSVKNSSNQRSDNPSGANGHHDLESDFFSQLAIIQVRKYIFCWSSDIPRRPQIFEKNLQTFFELTKGQKISEFFSSCLWLLQKPTIFFPNFCPNP